MPGADSACSVQPCVLALGELLDGATSLEQLWQRGALCDVTLSTDDGGTLPCHRLMLAAASPFFRALFAGDSTWSDTASAELPLHDVDADTLRTLVTALYTRRLEAPPRHIPALLAGATQLAFTALANACAAELRARLCSLSALATASLASLHGQAALEAEAESFAAGHFSEVLSVDPGGVRALPVDRLDRLLGSERLDVADETAALDALLDWAAAQSWESCLERAPSAAERKAALPRLLRRIRLCLVPPSALAQRADKHAACASCPEAVALLLRAAREQRERTGTGWSAQPRDSMPLRLLAAGGHDREWRPLRCAEWLDVRTGEWRPAQPFPVSASSFLSAVRVSGALLALCGGTYACAAQRADAPPPPPPLFDDDGGSEEPAQQSLLLAWQSAACPTARLHASLACLQSHAFYIGGRAGAGATELDLVERYDTATNEWIPAPPLCALRASGAAGTLHDTLYVVGGQRGRGTFDSMEALDAGSLAWRAPRAPLRTARKYLALAPLRGCLYALGGMRETRERLASVERFDPREGRWTTVAPMTTRRSSAAVVAAAGALWVVGGNDGERYHASCERYDAAADRWERVADMASARSGAALVAL